MRRGHHRVRTGMADISSNDGDIRRRRLRPPARSQRLPTLITRLHRDAAREAYACAWACTVHRYHDLTTTCPAGHAILLWDNVSWGRVLKAINSGVAVCRILAVQPLSV